jgi:hypothetical protein
MSNMGKSLALLLALIVVLSSLILCSVPLGFAQSDNSPSTFTISITASINNYSTTCIFGINPNSTTDYTPAYDTIVPHPSTGLYFFFRCPNQTIVEQKLSTFIIPSNGYASWFLEVDSIDQSGVLTLAWNDTSISSLTLQDGASKQVYADMNTVSNYSTTTTPGSIQGYYIAYQSLNAPPTPSPTPHPTPSPTPTALPIAQTPNYSDYIPTPTVPEFTLSFVQSSYSKMGTDPGTGITYQVNNNTIEVIIRNQPFSPYNYSWTYRDTTVNRGSTSLGYDVQAKEHYSQNWTEVYVSGSYPTQSNSSDYTVLSLPQGPSVVYGSPGLEIITPIYPSGNQIPSGSQLDFRVRAVIGGWFPPVLNSYIDFPLNFISKNSSWSNPQTITIPASSASGSPSPTPTVPEFPWMLAILTLLLAVSISFAVTVSRQSRQGSHKIRSPLPDRTNFACNSPGTFCGYFDTSNS